MSHEYLQAAARQGAAARDWQNSQQMCLAQLLQASPAQLVAYAARLCAHAADRTERVDLSHLALRLNKVSCDIAGQPTSDPSHLGDDLAGASTAEPAPFKLPAHPAPDAQPHS